VGDLTEECEMTDTGSFSALMERLRSGEDAASREIFDRFARRLNALARRQFDRRLAHRVDPEDVVQSAFRSFFVRQRDGTFRLGDWDELWSLLTLITLRKCVDRVHYLRAERRDVLREATAREGQDPPWQHALDREPRPEEAAALAEALEYLFQTVDDDDRPVLDLSLQGYTAAEIGLRLGRALRSVQRLREQIRKRLERYAREGLEVAG
jgi:RNA polymerase sigma factor (sigma-70 family)